MSTKSLGLLCAWRGGCVLATRGEVRGCSGRRRRGPGRGWRGFGGCRLRGRGGRCGRWRRFRRGIAGLWRGGRCQGESLRPSMRIGCTFEYRPDFVCSELGSPEDWSGLVRWHEACSEALWISEFVRVPVLLIDAANDLDTSDDLPAGESFAGIFELAPRQVTLRAGFEGGVDVDPFADVGWNAPELFRLDAAEDQFNEGLLDADSSFNAWHLPLAPEAGCRLGRV